MLIEKMLEKLSARKSATIPALSSNWSSGNLYVRKIGDEIQIDFNNLRASSTGAKSVATLPTEFRPKQAVDVWGYYIASDGVCYPAEINIGTDGVVNAALTHLAPNYGTFATTRFLGGGGLLNAVTPRLTALLRGCLYA